MNRPQTSLLPAASVGSIEVGTSFELSTAPVTTQQLVRYAGASGDYNRIHYDADFAKQAGLGGVIAHGMLTMALMGRAATDWAGPQGRVVKIAARFSAPVRPGDVVHVSGRVTGLERLQGEDRVECRLEADVAGRMVANGDATMLLRRAGPPGPEQA
jgi:acyl dehydratase